MAIDINNPGVVEIADQGYPKAPDGGEPAPTAIDVRIVDEATPPAPLESVFSADPAPPLLPFLPANQGNPLGLPVNLTVPAQDPVPLAQVQDVNLMLGGIPPVDPRDFIISQVGSMEINAAEAIYEAVVAYPSVPCNIHIVTAGCTFDLLTAGDLSLTIYYSDGTSSFHFFSLATIQALGAVLDGRIDFTPTPGKMMTGARLDVNAFQGPGLIASSYAEVQRTILPPGATDEDIIPETSILISTSVVSGTSGIARNIVVITDNETGLFPDFNTVNLRLTFALVESFYAKGIVLNGRPVTFEAIDFNRPILIMAEYYLVVTNDGPDGQSIAPGGIVLGDVISFDRARYAGEMIFQIDPHATQNVTATGGGNSPVMPFDTVVDAAPPVGILAETMNIKIDLLGCDFAALTNGQIVIFVTLASDPPGVNHISALDLPTLQALGNRRSAVVALPFNLGGPPPFVLPSEHVLQVIAVVFAQIAGPGLTAATFSVQRNGRTIGEIVPTGSALAVTSFYRDFNTQAAPIETTIEGPTVNANAADQIAVIGTPKDVYP
jgi:hypothetical protein